MVRRDLSHMITDQCGEKLGERGTLTAMTQSDTGLPRDVSVIFLRYVISIAITCSGEKT